MMESIRNADAVQKKNPPFIPLFKGGRGGFDGTDGIDRRSDGTDRDALRRQFKSFPRRFQRTPLSSLSQEK